MKIKIMMAGLILITGMMQAQDTTVPASDNKMWVSGTAQFRNYTDDDNGSDYSESGGEFSPAFGYSINDRWAVGIALSIEGIKIKDENNGIDTETKISEFSVNPFVRYYRSIGDRCALYGEFNIGFGSGKIEVDFPLLPNEEDTYAFFQTGISPGIQYWFHDNWSVNAEWGALRYRTFTDKADEPGESDRTDAEIIFGLDLTSLSFGLNFHF